MRGHKTIELAHNGERTRVESSWTWVCECGAQESCSTKQETMRERRLHLQGVRSIRTTESTAAPSTPTVMVPGSPGEHVFTITRRASGLLERNCSCGEMSRAKTQRTLRTHQATHLSLKRFQKFLASGKLPEDLTNEFEELYS